ncbi:MAG: flagellar basal body-associated FliL family protein [Tissierellaceae bacterium]|jgi:flagellar basal body-associated protein FliL
METKEKRSLDRILIVVLLAVILFLLVGIGYLLLLDKEMPDLTTIFKSNGEYTIPLDEFVVNLKSNKPVNNYARLSIALMYTDESYENELVNNMSKIRDLVITNLRNRTAEDLLNEESISQLKSSIKEDINKSFEESMIEDIYITNIIVQ